MLVVTASVASSPGGLVDLITIHLLASIFLGFLEAASRPSTLSPQGLCTCCVLCQQCLHWHLQGSLPRLQWGLAQMHYHPVPSMILPLKAATQHPQPPRTFSLLCFIFRQSNITPVMLCSVSVCLIICLPLSTASSMRGKKSIHLQLSVPSDWSSSWHILGTQWIFQMNEWNVHN